MTEICTQTIRRVLLAGTVAVLVMLHGYNVFGSESAGPCEWYDDYGGAATLNINYARPPIVTSVLRCKQGRKGRCYRRDPNPRDVQNQIDRYRDRLHKRNEMSNRHLDALRQRTLEIRRREDRQLADAILMVLDEDERLQLASQVRERLTRAIRRHPTVRRTWAVLTGQRELSSTAFDRGLLPELPESDIQTSKTIWAGTPTTVTRISAQNLLRNLSKDEIGTMAVFSGLLGNPWPLDFDRPSPQNVLHDLIDNLDDMVMWPENARNAALDLISKFNEQKTDKANGTVVALNTALALVFNERSLNEIKIRKIAIRENCGNLNAFRSFLSRSERP